MTGVQTCALPIYFKKSISKRKFAQGSLGTVQIQALNAEGEWAEKWLLNNVWISKISQDGFDYNGEDLLGISLTLVYDWADLEVNENLVTIG